MFGARIRAKGEEERRGGGAEEQRRKGHRSEMSVF
jgi:hypothetical protein